MHCQHPDDQPLRHYTTKHRIVAWISQNLFDDVTYVVRRGLNKGMKRKGGLAWLPEVVGGATLTPEQEFWRKQDFSGQVVYDVGAFQGLLTMYFARQARCVVSYEPNSRNHARLMENLRLNRFGNVRVRKVGVGAETGLATMVASPLMPGGASVEGNTVKGLRNSRQALVSEQIPIVSLDEDIREAGLPAPDFVKIDIEGGELAALTGARRTLAAYKARLFLEMHGETMNLKRRNVAALVDFLGVMGYTNVEHVESGTRIGPENSAVAVEGHLYCLPA